MALPPEQIRLKRKATEIAPETLYLQTDAPKRLRRSSDFAFQLLRPGIKPTSLSKKSFANAPVHHSSPRSVSHHGGPSIPTVRATTPGEELEEQRRLKKLREQKSHPDTSLGDGQAPSTEKPTAGPRLQEARRFHLSKPTTLSSNARANATQFKSHLDLALFVERRSEPQAQDLGTFVPVETEGAKDQISQQNVVTPRKKRPKANAAEKAFIEDQRKIRTNVDSRHIEVSETSHAPASRDNVKLASAEPSARTQQILFDMVDESKGLSDMSDLKVVLDDSLMDVDSQDDYVYETYIRIPRSQLVNQNDPTNKDVTYGILVIEEEDQGLWEMYAEADEDPTWEEEDEDSNAEDNPANEYPEDEIDSEDEFGYGAYKHRHNASDDEEYDLEDDAWSDGENRIPPFR